MPMTFESETDHYEYLIRSAGSIFSVFLIQAVETTLALRSDLEGTAAKQGVIGAIVGIYGCHILYTTTQIKNHDLSRTSRFVALSETAGAWLAFLSSFQAAISLGNQRINDVMIEGGLFAFALLLFASAKITQCMDNRAQTHVSLWKIFNNKVGRDNIPSSAGAGFGQSAGLGTLSIYAYQRAEYGTFGGELFVSVYSASIAAKMIYDWYQNRDENSTTHMPWIKFLIVALLASSAIFLTGALISFVNARPRTQCIQEGLIGGPLLLAGIIVVGIHKLQTQCGAKNSDHSTTIMGLL